MRFELTIDASTGGVVARVDSPEQVRELVSMVAAGAQVRRGMAVRLEDLTKRAHVAVQARSSHGICDAVDHALFALSALQPRPHEANENRDVSVRAHFAVDGSVTLEQAEVFVRKAVAEALDLEATLKSGTPTGPLYQYNGEPVPVGAGRWEN